MNLKKILKNKSGVALENTLLFMLVIFSMCALLTSLTLVGFFQTRINQITLLNEVELEQIGEEFIAHVKNTPTGEFTSPNENYVCNAQAGEGDYAGQYFLSVGHASNPTQVVLYICVARSDTGEINVLQWRYSLPQ